MFGLLRALDSDGNERLLRGCAGELSSRELPRDLVGPLGGELESYRGERRAVAELLDAPPSPVASGDECAAPRLVAAARRAGLRPLELRELWLGPAPPEGGRHPGVFYPACRGRCARLLPFQLEGLDVEPPPTFASTALGASVIVHLDDWLIVVDKPAGLLSVPGRTPELADSLLARLSGAYPECRVVHRLDLDTSGLVIFARNREAQAVLQRALAERRIDKRYAAIVDGVPRGEAGTIHLPMRVDLDDRPRQIVEPLHGRPTVTEWRVADVRDGRARVALWPRTGRTHQLRVAAAHAAGLGAPILGDRLYGRRVVHADERLALHADRLAFEHPRTGAPLVVESPAPFE